jgi:predicted  nucleic acid-binding Zn-ribbon protein
VARTTSKTLDLLEDRLDILLKRLQEAEKDRDRLEKRVGELERTGEEQADKVDRLKKQVSDASGDLDSAYLRKRKAVRERLAQVLARLEAL